MSEEVDWLIPYDSDQPSGSRLPTHFYDDLTDAGLGGGGGGTGGTPGPGTVTTTQVAAATLVNSSEGVGSNVNDLTWPTTAAVKEYIDARIAAITPSTGTTTVVRGDYQTATDRFHVAVALKDSQVVPIAFCGSSTTEGTGATGGAAFRYVNQFMQRLQTENPKVNGNPHPGTVAWGGTTTPPTPSATSGLFGVNYGTGGTSVTGVGGGLYLPATKITNMTALKPLIIIHLVGGNDWLNSTSSAGTPALYKTGLEAKLVEIDTALSGGTPTPHVHVLATPWESWSPVYNPPWDWKLYMDAMRDVAGANPYNRIFVDMTAHYAAIGIPPDGVHVTDEYGIIGGDDTHATDQGHIFLAKTMYDKLHARPLGAVATGLDTTNPDPPTLVYVASDAGSITYSINPALGGALGQDAVGVVGYTAYAGASDTQFAAGTPLPGGAGITTMNFTRSGLVASSPYSTYYKALDAKGNASVPSNIITHSTSASSDVTDPTAPAIITSPAPVVTPNSITYTFTFGTDDVAVTSYNAYTAAGIPAFDVNADQLGGSTSTTVTMDAPTGIAVDDILIAYLKVESTATVTPPSGWAAVSNSPVVGAVSGQEHYLNVFWKRAVTGDVSATDYSFTGSTGYRSGRIAKYTGCIKTGNPFDVVTKASAVAASTTSPAVSLTTTGSNRLLVWIGGDFNGGTWSAPSGFTIRDNTDGTGVATLLQTSAGATGSTTATNTVSGAMTAWMGALIPSAPALAQAGITYSTVAGKGVWARTGLTAGTSYAVYLTSVDGAGNESVPSNTDTRSTSAADTTPPTPPTITAATVGSNTIDYTYSGATDIGGSGVVSYKAYAGTGDQLAANTFIANTTTVPFTRGGLTGGLQYATYLTSVDAAGNESTAVGGGGGKSNTWTATTTAYRAHTDSLLIVDIDPNDAASGITGLANGAAVASITPSAGLQSAALVNAGTTKPTIKTAAVNGRRALVFNNAHVITSPNWSVDYGPGAGAGGGTPGPVTVFYVVKLTGQGTIWSGNTSGVFLGAGIITSPNLGIYSGPSTTPAVNVVPGAVYVVGCGIYNGTTSKHMLNVSTGGVAGTTSTASAARLTGIRLGASSAGTAALLTGEIARVMVLGYRVPDANIATEMLALGTDYNITVT